MRDLWDVRSVCDTNGLCIKQHGREFVREDVGRIKNKELWKDTRSI